MEKLLAVFGTMIVFTYHCFDRIVINGYLSMLSRPEQIVYFFRQVLGIKAITKEALTKRTAEYQSLCHKPDFPRLSAVTTCFIV